MYLQFASFLGNQPIEGEYENDGGDPRQRWRPQLLYEKSENAVKRMNGRWENCKSTSYLPEEEETKSNFNGCQPDGIEIHHKIHELLSVGRNQIHNLAHGASPPCSAVYHQWLYPKQKRKKTLQCNYTINIQKNSHHHLFKPEMFSCLDREEEFSLFAILTKVMSRG